MKTKLFYVIALLPLALLLVGATVVDKWGPFSYFQGDGGGITNVQGTSIVGPLTNNTTGTATLATHLSNTDSNAILAQATNSFVKKSGDTITGVINVTAQFTANTIANNAGGGITGTFTGDATDLTNIPATQLTGLIPKANMGGVTNHADQNAASLTNLNANSISSGSLADARLSANVPLLNSATNTFTGRQIAPAFVSSAWNAANPFVAVTWPANVGGVSYFTNTTAGAVNVSALGATAITGMGLSTTNLFPTFVRVPVRTTEVGIVPIGPGGIIAITNSTPPTLSWYWPAQ